jgi:Reverse transcriptase (RNA-dependent DNA polymerase)
VYVDDIVLTSNNNNLIQQFIHLLDQKVTIKDLDQLNYFLGIEVQRTAADLFLTQSQYIYLILDRANMQGAKSCSTPMSAGQALSKFDGSLLQDIHLYRSIVGALQYVTITRSNISFAVNRVSQFMHAPSSTHWQVVKRILRYLKGTIEYGLSITPVETLTIIAFADADWGGCPDDRKYTIGYLVFLESNLISWSSKKQTTIARSSTEAEFRGLASITAEVVWLKNLFCELGISITTPVQWCDNLGIKRGTVSYF